MAMMRRSRAGFTLVELMIALVAGSFAVAGVYYLNGMSSRMFGEQMRVSETQMSLRSAMEQLRREFSRAGYLHTQSSMVTPDCTGAFDPDGVSDSADGVAPLGRAARAIHVVHDGSLIPEVSALLSTPTVNQTRADRVDVWGNYATADAYLTDPAITSKTLIRFQVDSESFRRSFVDPSTGTVDAKRFTSAFAEGRMLRVEQDGRLFFRTITASTAAPTPSVTIDTLPWCFEPARWTAVAPIAHYRYGLEADSADVTRGLARLQPSSASMGSNRTLLVRREWNDGADRAMDNTARVVLDYAVEFGVEGFFDTAALAPTAAAPSPQWAPTWTLRRGSNVTPQSTLSPFSFRSLVVTLSSRSAEADPNLPRLARARFNDANLFDSPLLTFRVVGPGVPANVVLNARVRTMRSEIFLQNM